MKQYIFIFTLLCAIQLSTAQSEHATVEKTLQNYIEGSSYSKLEMLEKAFTENATLYLTGRDGAFKTLYTKRIYRPF